MGLNVQPNLSMEVKVRLLTLLNKYYNSKFFYYVPQMTEHFIVRVLDFSNKNSNYYLNHNLII